MEFDSGKYWKLLDQDKELSFKYLYDNFHGLIVGFCLKNGQSYEDAVEVAQEVFCKFWTSKCDKKKNPNIKAYLFSITRNVIIDNYRRIIREKAAKDYQFYLIGKENRTENDVLYNELYRDINRTFESMPEIRKLVFQMSRFRGYSNREIAQELGISIKTVEGHISKALRTFMKELNHSTALLTVVVISFLG